MWRVGANCWIIIKAISWIKKVAGCTKQKISLISSCCASPVNYDSFTDWASQEEQREISGRDQSEWELMKSQIDLSHNRITLACPLFYGSFGAAAAQEAEQVIN